MWSIRVQHVGYYSQPEVNRYTTNTPVISFTLNGLRSLQLMGQKASTGVAFFDLQPPGVETFFSYNDDRENFAILVDGDWMKPGNRPGTVAISSGEDAVEIPCILPVEAARAPGWQDEFTRLLDAFASPTARNRLRVQLGVLNIIRWFIDQEADSLAASPAADLKRRIDADLAHRYSLAELSEACGYSAEHIRLLFYARYSVNPSEYRLRRRLARAMDLVANSRLNVKEIAYTCGFTHSAHMCTAFRRAFGLSPRQAIDRYRHPH